MAQESVIILTRGMSIEKICSAVCYYDFGDVRVARAATGGGSRSEPSAQGEGRRYGAGFHFA